MRCFYSTLLLFTILFCSCKKTVETVYQEEPAPFVSEIKIEKTTSNSSITLRWNKYAGTGFQSYTLYRNARNQFPEAKLATFTNADSLTYTDSDLPYNPEISYRLDVATDSSFYFGFLSYNRPDFFYGVFSDVLINKEAHLLYLLSGSGKKIILIDYENNKKLYEKNYEVAFGFCALGNFESGINNELYIPRSDGWLDILDASNLELKTRIYVSGRNIASVVANGGKLFISSTDFASSSIFNNNAIKVYNRSDNSLIARTGINSNTRLLYLEGSNTELVDVTLNTIPTDLCHYYFDVNGNALASHADQYHGNYSMSPQILRSFPKGELFITASQGNIFNKSLVYQKSLSNNYYNGDYSDFAFNDKGSVIYAANAASQKIESKSYPQLEEQQSYSTSFFPYKIFKAGNELICISTTEKIFDPYYNYSYFTVEKIKL